MIPDEAQKYVDFFKEVTDVNDDETGYIISGGQMNDHYGLTSHNAYPRELNILVIPLKAFGDVGKIAIPMREIGGRWFTDVVDNNTERQRRIGTNESIEHRGMNKMNEDVEMSQTERLFNRFKSIDGFDPMGFFEVLRHYGPHENFYEFACYLNENLPEGCTARLGHYSQEIVLSYKNYCLARAYMTVNDKEIHYDAGKEEHKTMKMLGGPDACARRFLKKVVEPRILWANEQERKEEELLRRAEEAKIAKANKVNNFRSLVTSDAKDEYRAETAWARSNGRPSKYLDLLDQQLHKITDPNKAKRRIKAFYDHLLAVMNNDRSNPNVDRILDKLENRMLNRMTESRIDRRSLIESMTCELGDDDIEAIVREFDDSGENLTFKDVTEFIKDLPLFAIQYTESDGDEEILDALDAEVKELANTVIRELKMCRG